MMNLADQQICTIIIVSYVNFQPFSSFKKKKKYFSHQNILTLLRQLDISLKRLERKSIGSSQDLGRNIEF